MPKLNVLPSVAKLEADLRLCASMQRRATTATPEPGRDTA